MWDHADATGIAVASKMLNATQGRRGDVDKHHLVPRDSLWTVFGELRQGFQADRWGMTAGVESCHRPVFPANCWNTPSNTSLLPTCRWSIASPSLNRFRREGKLISLCGPEVNVPDCGCRSDASQLERRTLRFLLLINGALFVLEAIVGWIGQSTGLLADTLDMLADATVYGTALYASGRSSQLQRGAAFASGIIQISLGLGVFVQVVRRFLAGSDPIS